MKTYEKWRRDVSKHVMKTTGVQLDDIPDCNPRLLFEDLYSSESAAEIIKIQYEQYAHSEFYRPSTSSSDTKDDTDSSDSEHKNEEHRCKICWTICSKKSTHAFSTYVCRKCVASGNETIYEQMMENYDPDMDDEPFISGNAKRYSMIY